MIDAAMLGAAGSFLGGIGSLGGVFGSGGDGIDVSENRRLIKMQNEEKRANAVWERGHQRAQIRGMNSAHWGSTVAAAKRYGMHPLWALGKTAIPAVSGSGSPHVIAGQSNGGSHMGDSLAGVGRAMSQYAENKLAQQAHSSNLELNKALKEKYLSEAKESDTRASVTALQYADSVNSRNAARNAISQDTPKMLRKTQTGDGAIDITDYVPVDDWQKYFGEAGEWEQSLRNYKKRWETWKKEQHGKKQAEKAWLKKAKREGRYGRINR